MYWRFVSHTEFCNSRCWTRKDEGTSCVSKHKWISDFLTYLVSSGRRHIRSKNKIVNMANTFLDMIADFHVPVLAGTHTVKNSSMSASCNDCQVFFWQKLNRSRVDTWTNSLILLHLFMFHNVKQRLYHKVTKRILTSTYNSEVSDQKWHLQEMINMGILYVFI